MGERKLSPENKRTGTDRESKKISPLRKPSIPLFQNTLAKLKWIAIGVQEQCGSGQGKSDLDSPANMHAPAALACTSCLSLG